MTMGLFSRTWQRTSSYLTRSQSMPEVAIIRQGSQEFSTIRHKCSVFSTIRHHLRVRHWPLRHPSRADRPGLIGQFAGDAEAGPPGRPHPIFEEIPDGSYFYFVHSYYPQPADSAVVIGETDYGVTFPSVVARDNLVATQFHPEKSGDMGLRMYSNFLRIATRASVA